MYFGLVYLVRFSAEAVKTRRSLCLVHKVEWPSSAYAWCGVESAIKTQIAYTRHLIREKSPRRRNCSFMIYGRAFITRKKLPFRADISSRSPPLPERGTLEKPAPKLHIKYSRDERKASNPEPE